MNEVKFNIEDGDFVGIVGPTGSGKTTLLYCLNGLIPNSIKGEFSGEVLVDGVSTTQCKVSDLAKKVGIVFQDPDWQLFSLTVKDEVAFGLKNLHMDRVEERVKEALKLVGLTGLEDVEPYKLSQGQKQMLCIACVLAMQPKTILLDEPTSNLDYKNTKNIYGLLKKLNHEGRTIVIAEHDTDLLAEYANKVLVISDGKIVKNGLTKEVFSDKVLLEKLGIKIPRVDFG
ncbi:MAG: energy-coupling factor ABC transporter ATP-binding protein [Candidatus Bathyarchaeota archaeon]